MSMNDNIINLATSPALDACLGISNSIASDLAETYAATVETIKPKAYGLEATARKLDSMEKVNILPCYKVTCNLHSVNSAKLLYLY